MKKILVITALFCSGIYTNIYAQICSPDPIYLLANLPGLFPTPTEGIASGIDGTSYSQVFTVIVPADTTISIPPAPATTLTVNTVTIGQMFNLPPGLQFDCDITNCIFPGGTNGCLLIDGTPTMAGTYDLQIEFIVNVEVPVLGPTDAPAQTYDYTLTIDTAGTVSMEKISTVVFEVYPVTPNPSNSGAEIRFSSPGNRDVKLTVHNMIGAVVISKSIYAEQGMNVVSFKANDMNPGVYFVTLTDGANTSTKRMVVGSR